MIGLPLHLLSKNVFFLQKTAKYAPVEAQNSTTKKLKIYNIKLFKFKKYLRKVSVIESAATINFNCNEIFTPGLSRKPKNYAQKWQVNSTSIVKEPCTPFHTLAKIASTEVIMTKKRCTLLSPLGNNKVIQNWSLKPYLLRFLIHFLKSCSHKQLIQVT